MGNPSNGEGGRKARTQPEEALKCPRCDSTNTKFCYYNNYSLSQPRYFCKSCRRYWTKGGTLRKVPVGGGCRKTKRSSPPPTPTQEQTLTPNTHPIVPPLTYDHIDPTNDLTVAFAALQKQYDASHLSILENPSYNVAGSVANPGLLGNLDNFQGFGYDNFWEAVDNGGPTVGFNGETMLPYNNQNMIESTTTTSDVAVTDNRSVLWGLPWQLIGDSGNNDMVAATNLDCAIDYWHGILNSPDLM
ncbi:hypothetical protein V6N13_052032 [Hibiscus sabdariffa]|uniref:Dof zinc finger protein n=1 Tax=Hibiscus sabdariffa TaxID=183260 RepID=A0ABR2T656_9ROSI